MPYNIEIFNTLKRIIGKKSEMVLSDNKYTLKYSYFKKELNFHLNIKLEGISEVINIKEFKKIDCYKRIGNLLMVLNKGKIFFIEEVKYKGDVYRNQIFAPEIKWSSLLFPHIRSEKIRNLLE